MAPRDLIAGLGLARHPEGGWFRETWRSPLAVTTPRGTRAAGTSILYLLADGAVSRLHRLAWDEVWHHHGGGPLDLHLLEAGGPRTLELSADQPQQTVPAGTWFGAECRAAWCLAGCTMAPGFDPADFELAGRAELLAAYPAASALIQRLTPTEDAS